MPNTTKPTLPEIHAVLSPSWQQNQQDEIDLTKLILNLWQQKKLIALLVILTTVSTAIITQLLPKTYRVEAIINQPNYQAVAPIIKNSLEQQVALSTEQQLALAEQGIIANSQSKRLTTDDIYLNAFKSLQNITVRKQAFNDLNMAEKLQFNPSFFAHGFSHFQQQIKISKVRAEWLELSKDEKTPLEQVIISVETAHPELMADYLNHYIELANQQSIANLLAQQTQSKELELAHLNSDFAQFRLQTIATFTAQLLRYTTALELATTLNIKQPVQNAEANNALHLYGMPYLANAIATLEDKIKQLTLTNELSMASLQTMASLGLSIDEVQQLSELISRQQKLDAASLDFSNSKALTIEQAAFVPASPIAPKSLLITAAAMVLSLFFAMFVALMRSALRSER